MPIKGFPMKYELKGGWTIPRSDLKYLIKGPLASEGLSEILVPAALGWQRFLLYIRQFGTAVSTLIAIAGAFYRWREELAALFALVF